MMASFKLTPAKLILSPEQPQCNEISENINISVNENMAAEYPDDWDTEMTDSPAHEIRKSPVKKLIASTPDYPSYKKWHIMSLRTKLNKLGKNDHGTREELITRLDEYYRDLPKNIREANNPWLCDDLDNIFSSPAPVPVPAPVEELITTSISNQSESPTHSDNVLPQLMIEVINILEILSQRFQSPISTIQAEVRTTSELSTNESKTKSSKACSKIQFPWKQVSGKSRSKSKSNESHNFQLELQNSFEALQSNASDPIEICEERKTGLSHSKPASNRKNHERPRIVINEKPDSDNQNWSRTTPGNSSYAAVANNNKKLALFSDNMCNRMGKHELRRKFKCAVNKKAFPGATSIDMHSHYMIPTLENDVPDIAIIHTGINDVIKQSDDDGGLTADAISEIANNIIKCGQVCRMYGVNKVCVSSIILKKGVKTQASIILINDALARLCVINSFDFLSNVNIPYTEPREVNSLFYTDGLHLNDKGRDILIGNFLEYLNTN